MTEFFHMLIDDNIGVDEFLDYVEKQVIDYEPNENLSHLTLENLESSFLETLEIPTDHEAIETADEFQQITEKHIEICSQPARYFQFNFQSDINKFKTTKTLTSIHLTMTAPPPAAFLHNAQLYVLCTLYMPANSAAEEPRLSPHFLAESDTKNVDYIVLKEMNASGDGTFRFFLKNFYLLETKKEHERINVLKRKYEEIQKLLVNGNLTPNQLQSIDNRVTRELEQQEIDKFRFGFTIFNKLSDATYKKIGGPFFSNTLAVLKIEKITNPKGPIVGGKEVTLVVSDELTNDFKIRIYETASVKNKINWEQIVDIKEVGIKNITFITPPFGGTIVDKTKTEFSCNVQIVNPNDDTKSNTVRFIYERILDEPNAKRRCVAAELEDQECDIDKFLEQFLNTNCSEKFFTDSVTCTKSSLPVKISDPDKYSKYFNTIRKLLRSLSDKPQTEETQKILENIVGLNKSYAAGHSEGNTVFHDAIVNNDFLKLYKILIVLDPVIRTKFAQVRNNRRETLLHFACRHNKSSLIRPLIGIGCRVNAQADESQTPLHIAIQLELKECLEAFSKLFIEPTIYENLPNDFRELLETYDRKGHTILHRAVLADLRTFVGDVLTFCENAEIDAGEIEVLGNGDTILHLAVREKLSDMAQLILKCIPEIATYKNYAGYDFRNIKNFNATEELTTGLDNLVLK